MRALLALALLSAAPASAQRLSVGLSGGAHFARLGDVTAADPGLVTGYHAGLHLDAAVSVLALRTGVYYLHADDRQPGAGGVSAGFVAVPLDLRLRTPTPVVRAYALAGPEARWRVTEDGAAAGRHDLSVAGHVGAGVELQVPLGGPSAFLELRYAFDLSDEAAAAGVPATAPALDMVLLRLGVGL